MIEVVVALGLLALLLPLVFDLIPGGLLAQRRGRTLQGASALAFQWIEEARASPPTPASDGVDRQAQVDISGDSCNVTREVFAVPPRPNTGSMWDVVVTVRPSRGEPVVMATRVQKK